MYKFLFEHLFSVLLGIYIGVELLGCTVILCLTFWRTNKIFSTASTLFYIPTSSVWGFQPPHLHQQLLFSFYYYCCCCCYHSSGYEMVSHCGFDFTISNLPNSSLLSETQHYVSRLTGSKLTWSFKLSQYFLNILIYKTV